MRHFIFLSLVLSSSASIAQIQSMSRETVANNGAHTQVFVQCRFQNERLFIHKETGAREWCDQQLKDVRAPRKMAAAQKVCGYKYISQRKENALNSNETLASS